MRLQRLVHLIADSTCHSLSIIQILLGVTPEYTSAAAANYSKSRHLPYRDFSKVNNTNIALSQIWYGVTGILSVLTKVARLGLLVAEFAGPDLEPMQGPSFRRASLLSSPRALHDWSQIFRRI